MKKHTFRPIRARVTWITIALLVSLPAAGALSPINSQSLTSVDRDRGHVMLKSLKNEIKKNYYDPTFRGIDLDARFKTADEKIDHATSLGQILGIVAQVLLDFEDSHLFFLPPQRSATYDYGWQMQLVGDKCYVSAVKPGGDAEAKGLKPGDLVKAVDGFVPARENLWKLKYLYYALRPQPGMRLVVQSPEGPERQIDVMTKITQGKLRTDLTGPNGVNERWDQIRKGENADRLRRHRYVEMGDDVMIWKMPQFDMDAREVDDVIGKANKRKALILDLRGNHGGFEETLKNLLGRFVEADVKIGDAKRRTETKPIVVEVLQPVHY